MNVVYILFKKNNDNAPFIMAVYGNEEDAYARKQQLFQPENYFIEEWEIQ